jgi:uncharacterized OsmC-like protein
MMRLATAQVSSQSVGLKGRGIISAKNHHLVVDSPLALGGPNEELNPIDLLLAALASHGMFVCEKAAQELAIPLKSITITSSGDFDPRGVTGELVDPRIQTIRIWMMLCGPNPAQAEMLVAALKTRCTIYTTLSRALVMHVEVVLDKPDETPGFSMVKKAEVATTKG